jgi:molecular chaperone GrpE
MTKKPDDKDLKIFDLVNDLQRERANFANYRSRVDEEKQSARSSGASDMAVKILPVIDDIERAAEHLPAELADNAWAKGVANLAKNLTKTLEKVGITRIPAEPGSDFNPDLHHAVQFDETDGKKEIIAEELQPGYLYNGAVLRPAMVRVTRK